METHSNSLAWKIPWTGEPSGLLSMGSQRTEHNQAQAQMDRISLRTSLILYSFFSLSFADSFSAMADCLQDDYQ